MQAALTVIRFVVSVPVLSVQMVVAEPMVSQDSKVFTKLFCFDILLDVIASEIV